MKRKTMITLALLSALGASTAAWAVDYPLPPANSRLIGQNQYWTVQEGDRNLQAIARHFDTAAMLILEANDTIAPVQPKPGTQVLIPSQMLLPDVPREGIVVNLAELRLYYFPPGENQVQVYPLGIGQLGLETPEMTTRVGQKIPNPTWTPTAGIRARTTRRLIGPAGNAWGSYGNAVLMRGVFFKSMMELTAPDHGVESILLDMEYGARIEGDQLRWHG